MKNITVLVGLALLGTFLVLMPEAVKELPLPARLWVFAIMSSGFLLGHRPKPCPFITPK